jgi:hypothetical protein
MTVRFDPAYGLALGTAYGLDPPEFPLMFSRLELGALYSHRSLNNSVRLFTVLCVCGYNMLRSKLQCFILQANQSANTAHNIV